MGKAVLKFDLYDQDELYDVIDNCKDIEKYIINKKDD